MPKSIINIFSGLVLSILASHSIAQSDNGITLLSNLLGPASPLGGHILAEVPVLGDLTARGLGGLPIAGELLGGELLTTDLVKLDGGLIGDTLKVLGANDSSPLALGLLFENQLFETLLIGNVLTGNLVADIAPVSAVFLYEPVDLLSYFLDGGTVIAPIIALLPPIPIISSPLTQ